MAVSPERLTNFNRNQSELEQLIIFSVAVAGKTANTTAKAIERFFDGGILDYAAPSHWLTAWLARGDEFVLDKLKAARIGNYNRLLKFFKEFVADTPTLKTLNVEALRKFHGISYKTAKMIVLHSKPAERHAVIDTHVLKFLRDVIGVKNVPKASPSSFRRYEMLEDTFLHWIDERIRYQRHVCIPKPGGGLMDRCVTIERDPLTGKANYAKFDLDLWNIYSGNGRN